MTPRDRINSAAMNVINAIKDNIATDLLRAQQSETIKIDEKQLRLVITLTQQLIDATYYRSNRAFMRAVDAALTGVGQPAPEKKA